MPISAENYVQINPGVVNGGGTSLSLNSVFLTTNELLPAGTIYQFTDQKSVGNFFGTNSSEFTAAGNYFLGLTNKTQTPGLLYFAPYFQTSSSAFLLGGSLAGLTLAELQSINGTLTITIDGVVHTTSTLNLSTAISFTNAASLITTALSLTGGSICIWNSIKSAFVIKSGTTGITSTITICTGNTASPLLLSSSSGVTLGQGSLADTPISAMTNITNNTKNWASFSTIFEPDTSTKLLFAQWNNSKNQRYHYVMWDTNPLASTQNGTTTAGYLCKIANYDGISPIGLDPSILSPKLVSYNISNLSWDDGIVTIETLTPHNIFVGTTIQGIISGAIPTGYNGTFSITAIDSIFLTYELITDPGLATFNGVFTVDESASQLTSTAAYFLCGGIASVNFNQKNGRVAFKFKTQSGLLPTCENDTTRANLLLNGYNLIAQTSTAADLFTFYDDGAITGKWLWCDSYINQIYLNSQFQLYSLELLLNSNSLPYNQDGYAALYQTLQTPIQQMINFGGIRIGVRVSNSQAAIVNAQAGLDIVNNLQTQGYFLQILDPGSQIRSERGSPIINFWYMDGQSVQFINIASINIQ